MNESDAGSGGGVGNHARADAALFDRADDPILAVGRDCPPSVVAVNDAFRSVFGYQSGPGRSIVDLEAPDAGDAERALLGSVRAGRTDTARVERHTPDGLRTFEVTAVPASSPDVEGFLRYRDVTERVIRDQQLAVLRRVVRHDLRNDLTALLGYARSVARTTDEPRTREAAETIVEAADDLSRLARSAGHLRAVTECGEIALVNAVLARTRRGVEAARVETTGPDREIVVDGRVEVATTELCEVLAEDGTASRISIDASADDGEVTIRTTGDAALPDQQVAALSGAEETPLRHASGVGPWLVRWAARSVGGRLDVETGSDRIAVSLSVPVLDRPEGRVRGPDGAGP